MNHLQLNHWAILVSAIMQWLLGAVWYSPALFAKPWMAALGIQKGSNSKGMVAGMISSFVGSLILSFVLAHMVLWSGATSFGMGALWGFVAWCGFIAAPAFPQNIYEGRPFKLFAINTGYWLVAMLITGGLLAVWR